MLDGYRPLLVETDTSSIQDGRGQDGVGDSGKAVVIVIPRLRLLRVDASRSIDEFLDGDVAVAALAIEVTALGR